MAEIQNQIQKATADKDGSFVPTSPTSSTTNSNNMSSRSLTMSNKRLNAAIRISNEIVNNPDSDQVTDDEIERFLFPRRTSKADLPPVSVLEIEDGVDGGDGFGHKKTRESIGLTNQLHHNSGDGEFKIEIESKRTKDVDNGLMNIDTINLDASQTLVSSLRDGGHDSDSSIESEQVPSISGKKSTDVATSNKQSYKEDPPKPSRSSALEDLRRRKRELETLRQKINNTS